MGARIRPASPGTAVLLMGLTGMGIGAGFDEVACRERPAGVSDNEAKSGSSSDFFFVLKDGSRLSDVEGEGDEVLSEDRWLVGGGGRDEFALDVEFPIAVNDNCKNCISR